MRYAYVLYVISAFFCLFPGAAKAEHTPDDLKRIEAKIRQEKGEQTRLNAKAKSIKKDLLSTRKELIATAKVVQNYEETLSKLERQLGDLQEEKKFLLSALAHRDTQMVETLAALENLAWRPTEALLVQPTDPVSTVRSAILMKAAVPRIETAAAFLKEDLERLNRLKIAVASQHARISVVAADIDKEHKRMRNLVERKTLLQKQIELKSSDSAKRVMALSKEASSLRDLLSRLQKEKKRMAALERGKRAAEALGRKPSPTAKKATPPPESPPTAPVFMPSLSIAKAKGRLPYPAKGRVILAYGAKTDTGTHTKGITLRTRKNAQVIAPYDGTVLFSGPFRGYGQLLIIEHGDGYHTLLAGLHLISTQVGQTLLAGEPVGKMARTKAPELYIELRRNGQPINPLPWLVASKDRDKG